MKAVANPASVVQRLADAYRALKARHGRQPAHRAARRALARQMEELESDFERMLRAWVPDDPSREPWRRYLHGAAEGPAPLHIPAGPLFRGRNDAGAEVELRENGPGYDLIVDGARIDRSDAPWHLDPDMIEPIQIGEYTCEEVFAASPAAIRALADFLTGTAAPPWTWARELVADGLIDAALGLTARGSRCLKRSELPAMPEQRTRNRCVLVADAARARVLVLEVESWPKPPTTRLVKIAELMNPMLRARDAELVSESRPGLQQAGRGGPAHAVSDHREERRQEATRRFATRVAEETSTVWRQFPTCELIVVASPTMLGLLRPAIDRQRRTEDQVEVRELARDLTKLTPPKLHDLLAQVSLLPERGRRPPMHPAPGQPLPT